jgi:hypothetical protein
VEAALRDHAERVAKGEVEVTSMPENTPTTGATGEPPASPRWHIWALLGVLLAVLLSAFPYFEQVRNANEIPRLVQAMSLVEHGEWAIDGESRRGIPLGPDIARSPADDHLYPNKPPGASLVGAVAFVLAKLGPEPLTLRELTWWARLLAGVVPMLVIAAVAWGQLRNVYGGPISSATILLFTFGTPMFAYARLFYGHALAAALLFVGTAMIERGSANGRRLELMLGGMLAASAIGVEYGAAFAGIPIAIMLVWPLLRPSGPVVAPAGRSSRAHAAELAAVALTGALVPIMLLAAYQHAVFGSVWSTGYHNAADPSFAALHGQGLLGLGLPRWDNVRTHLLSLDGGLLLWSSLVVIGLLGLGRLVRHDGTELRRVARLQLGIFVVVLIMGLGLSFEGGWRVGPRYLVVAMPMLMLGIAEFTSNWRENPRAGVAALAMGLLGVAASWSLIANTLAATLWPHIDTANITEPFGAVLIPLWNHGYGPYGLPTYFRGGLALCLVAPVGLGLGALIWSAGMARPRVVLVPMLLGAAMGAVGLLLLIPRVSPAHPKSERNLQYIEKVYEPRVHEGKRVHGHTRRL